MSVHITSVIALTEHEVDSTALYTGHIVGQAFQATNEEALAPCCGKLNPCTFANSLVAQNVLFCSLQVLAPGALELLDVLLTHIDQKRQVGGVAPEAD